MIRHGEAPFLECSSKGDKRFSALFARIAAQDNKTIEEIYQASKVFSDGSTGLSWKAAKGRKAENAEEVRRIYGELWDAYMRENPDLYEPLINASGLSDMFGQEGHACQATELWRIRDQALMRLARLDEAMSRLASKSVGVCVSGGAIGADQAWGKFAKLNGHEALHWSFFGHNPQGFSDEVHGILSRLGQESLNLAVGEMRRTAKTIGRSLGRSAGVQNLICRNWYQIRWSHRVYAVASIGSDGLCNGGTGWAVETFRARKTGDLYLYDQNAERWLTSERGAPYREITQSDVPPPEGIWTGIGTRKLSMRATDEIKFLCEKIRNPVCSMSLG